MIIYKYILLLVVVVFNVQIVNAKENYYKVDIANFLTCVWQNSPIMQEANINMDIATAEKQASAKFLYNPEFEFSIENKAKAKQSKSFGISQTIDLNSKYKSNNKIAKFKLKTAIAEKDKIYQDFIIDLLSAFVDYNLADELLLLTNRHIQIMQTLKNFSKKSFDSGDIDKNNYNLSRIAYMQALMQQIDAKNNMIDNKKSFDSIIGFAANCSISKLKLPDKLPDIVDINVKQIIKNLPKIRILKNQQYASNEGIKRNKLNKLSDPTISFTSSNEGESITSLSVSIPINIFNNYENEVNVAKYKNIANLQSLEVANYLAKININSSKNKYKLIKNAWDSWQLNKDVVVEQIKILDKKFKLNEINITNYLLQLQQILAAKILAKNIYAKAWKS